MTPFRRGHRLAIVATALALALTSVASPAMAVDAPEEDAADTFEAEAVGFWRDAFLDARVRDDFAAFVDGLDLDAQGQPLDVPIFVDVQDFGYAVTRKRRAQIERMRRMQRQRRAQPIIGAQARQRPGTDSLYVGWQAVEPMPRNLPGGLVFTIVFYGPGGVPLYPGGAADPIAGSIALHTGGRFEGQRRLQTGGTDTRGLGPGERPDYDNARARVNGVYRNGRWLIEVPIPAGATAWGGVLEGEGVDGALVRDRMTNGAGLALFPLGTTDVSGDACISGTAFPIRDAAGAVDRMLVRFVVHDPAIAAGFDRFPFSVSGESGFGATPAFVPLPELAIATSELIVPPERITFGAADVETDASSDDAPFAFDTWRTYGSESDLASFMDGWSVELGGGRSGDFVGDLGCGSLRLPATPQELSDRLDIAERIAAIVGIDDPEISRFDGADDSDVHVVFDRAAPEQGALLAIVVGNMALTEDAFAARVDTSFCEVSDVPVGSPGILEVCPDDTHRLFLFDPLPGQSGGAAYGRTTTLEFPGAAWPNGRRIGDDVSDIALAAVLGASDSPIAVAVDELRQTYRVDFPYLGAPSGE